MEREAILMESREVKLEGDELTLPVERDVVKRLVSEVEDKTAPIMSGYNRSHNRHNR